MRTLLVVASHPELADAVRASLAPSEYQMIHRLNVDEAEPLLVQAALDACIVDADLAGVQSLWLIERIRQRAPKCPLIVYTTARPADWEEDAYLHGVSHVLTKPVRGRLLQAVLDRLWSTVSTAAPAPNGPRRLSFRPREPRAHTTSDTTHTVKALEVLRDFSGILTHSLRADAMLRQFLLLLREILGVNRAAIFLRQPFGAFGGAATPVQGRGLRSACAIGLPPGLLEHFELSFETGIGGFLFRRGRILRQDSDEALEDLGVQKEFEVLGAQVAVPILDRENLVGVAAFDGRVTGEPLSNGELELIFHLLEELGLAIKNIWLHDQLAANHEMMADILRELSSACVVISRDLVVLHANKMARHYFARPGHRGAELEFSDLPQLLGSKVYQVLRTGTGLAPFQFHPTDSADKTYQITIVPFQRSSSILPNSVLLIVDDRTQSEQLQRLEIEAANLRLVKTMADRLAHEIGNALVPLSTHQQLLGERYKDADFRASLDLALADGVKRISRLINQMRFLGRDAMLSKETFPVAPLIEEAFQEAQKQQPAKSARLKLEAGSEPIAVSGDRSALKHALAEVLLNALQANPAEAKVSVRAQPGPGNNGRAWLELEVQDNGPGFSSESAKKAVEPFYTTRNVGLGLGLAVAGKIIETHQGRLTIPEPKSGEPGIVRISLPLESGRAS